MKFRVSAQFTFLILFCASLIYAQAAQAGTIDSWNLDNVTVDSGPYEEGITYSSVIYTDAVKTVSNGAVIWVESDVQQPGLSVVTNDDVNSSNCVMTSGINPEDATIKQCSDPFQTSKRFKTLAGLPNSAIDLVFDVSGSADVKPYRILQKYLNSTGLTVHAFNINLGFGTGASFVAAEDGDGLDFSDRDGAPWEGEVLTGETDSLNLDALFPFGLFGDADTDPDHDLDGYFDPTARARFLLKASRRLIESTGITPNYFDMFGDWLPKSLVLQGYFLDHDNDPLTDPVTVAHLGTTGWITLRPDSWWLDTTGSIPAENPDGTLADSTLESWDLDPPYSQGAIDDLANLNLNFHVSVGDFTLWPTYAAERATFTLRISSASDQIFSNGFED